MVAVMVNCLRALPISSQYVLPIVILFTSVISSTSSSFSLVVVPELLFVAEDWPVGSDLPNLNICAVGSTAEENVGLLTLQIGDSTYFAPRSLNDTCWTLRLLRQLDADLTNDKGQRGQSFSLSVTCRTKGGGARALHTVDVIVTGVNDNRPQFQDTPASVSVSENESPGKVLAPITVYDPDSSLSGISSFRLLNDYGLFNMTGVECSNSRCSTSLLLIGKLNYDIRSRYQLIIEAKDGAGQDNKSNKATFELTINVLDTQNNPPKFVTTDRVFTVAEDARVNSRVILLKAKDGDDGVADPRLIKYRLAVENQFFGIDPDHGWIYVSSELDREHPSVIANDGAIALTVEATEQDTTGAEELSTTANITVIIKDVDDQRPRCEKANYRASISENAQISTQITLTDAENIRVYDLDQGDNADFHVDLVGAAAAGFQVTPQTVRQDAFVVIKVKDPSQLDFEVTKIFDLEIVLTPITNVISSGSSRQYGCLITLELRNQNDNAPEFNQTDYSGSVLENQPTGTAVMRITAFDADGDRQQEGALTFGVTGAGSQSFVVDADGMLRTAAVLDRETTPNYHLTLVAADDHGRGHRSTASLRVTVLDMNDQAPVFEHQSYRAFLYENQLSFQQMPNGFFVKAFDADMPGTVNSNISYYMSRDSEGFQNFTVDPLTGEITPIGVGVDRESMDDGRDFFNLTIVAKDNGLPQSLSSTTNAIIYINDTNDNQPTFSHNHYEASILENATGGAIVATVHAIDADATLFNNKIQYRISSIQDRFQVHPDTGQVTVARGAVLDTSAVTAAGGRRVIDEVSVVAVDQGYPQLSARAVLRVTVVDVNDKPPRFTQDRYQVSVFETAPIATSVLNLTATDPDSTAELQFAIVSYFDSFDYLGERVDVERYNFTNMFVVNGATGELTTHGELDRESVETVTLRVRVTDMNAQMNVPQNAHATVEVRVLDANDNAPRFLQKAYQARIHENAPIGTNVLTVSALDPDSSSTYVRYSIGEQESRLLDIHPTTGEVKVVGTIDYETTKWINTTVIASDDGEQPHQSQALLSVQVDDQNDNSPVFVPSNRYAASVREDMPVGTPVLTVTTTDVDSADLSKITYSFLSSGTDSTADELFEIDRETGEIRVKHPLDRETLAKHSLVIRAIDAPSTHQATAVVEITVLDANDNAPQFVGRGGASDEEPKRLHLSENDMAGTVVATFTATDADDEQTANAAVNYYILRRNDTDFLFVLNLKTGALSLNKDLRGRNGLYWLELEARDGDVHGGGGVSLATTMQLIIQVRDFNDHRPTILTPAENAVFEVVENRFDNDGLVTVIRAVDRDDGVNAMIDYRLKRTTANKDWKHFRLNGTTGALHLVKPIDREQQQRYSLTVEVCDKGDPPQCNNREFSVDVIDQNDNCPYFDTDEEYRLSIPENQPTHGLYIPIGRIPAALDSDRAAQNRLNCYTIVESNPKTSAFAFEMANSTLLVTNVSLDRETTAVFTMVVLVDDCNDKKLCEGLSTKRRSLRVSIRVSDVNDNYPRFVRRHFVGGGVKADVKIGTRVAKVVAVDADAGDANHALKYFMKGSVTADLSGGYLDSDRVPFIVNETTGDVFTNIVFKPSWKGAFRFVVGVVDTAAHQDTAVVSIDILSADQQVELIFAAPANRLWDESTSIIALLSMVTQANATIDDIQSRKIISGVPAEDIGTAAEMNEESIVLVHFVDHEHNMVIPIEKALRWLDRPDTPEQKEAKRRLISLHRLKYAGRNEVAIGGRMDYRVYLTLAIVIGGLLLVMIVLLGVWCYQNRRYRRKLKAATTFAFAGGLQPAGNAYTVPNTNLHSAPTSNPLWNGSVGRGILTGAHHFPIDYEIQPGSSEETESQNSLDQNDLLLRPPMAAQKREGMDVGLRRYQSSSVEGDDHRSPQQSERHRWPNQIAYNGSEFVVGQMPKHHKAPAPGPPHCSRPNDEESRPAAYANQILASLESTEL